MKRPGDIGFRIEHVWAFISIGEDGEEGIIATQVGDTFMPFIAADEIRLEQMREMAQKIATMTRTPVQVARLEHRIDLEVIEP